MPLNVFRPPSPTDRFSRSKRYELTLLVCAIAWLITEALYGKIATANLAMIFLLAVLVVAVNLGRNPAILAVVLCVSAFDFLYVPPRFSFAITDFQYLITLGVMLVTAMVTALALLPIALKPEAAGQEIEGPMAIVILGGLVTSTALNLLVLPTLALRYGKFTVNRET